MSWPSVGSVEKYVLADHKRLDPLLLAKLQRPLLPQDSAPRPRLLKSLSRILDHPLTLVSAPAGFGKSTLVAQALPELAAPAAWLTVDEYDNDLRSFLDYLIAALQTQIPDACAQTQRLVGAVQLPPVEYVAASLLNEIAAIPQPFIVVLDDFHYLTDPAIDQLFTMLLRAVPAPLHLVVLTQTDPGWPLARLIGRGQLLQLRATDLRFRVDEAEAFLEIATGGTLSRETAASLVQRTEGWIVALRLAALTVGLEPEASISPNGSQAPADRLTPPFLVHEMLARHSPAMRDFLLRTSILDRLNASLCAALMDPSAGDSGETPTVQSISVWLRNTNLLILPLGTDGEWFRYHSLFRELLQRELGMQWDAARIAGLHRRASEWYATHGLVEEALRYALDGGDTGRAADIVESQVYLRLNLEDWQSAEGWLALLPEGLIRGRPLLQLARAWLLSLQHKTRAVQRLVETVEARLANPQAELSPSEREAVRAKLATLEAYNAWWNTGELELCLERAREGWSAMPRDRSHWRSLGIYYEALALYALGRQAEAIALLRHVVDTPHAAPVIKARPLLALATIFRVAGPLPELEQTVHVYLQLAETHDLPLSKLWSHYLLGSLHYERNELEQAIEQLEAVAEQRYLGHYLCGLESMTELALAYQAQGRARPAGATARHLAEFCLQRNGESQAECLSLRVRLALARNDLDEAVRGAAHLPGVPPVSPMILSEIPAITRAQALLAGGSVKQRQQALDLLEALEAAAEVTHTLRPLVRILALQAVGLAAAGRGAEAQARLERAVTLAEPMGLIRTFVDVGPTLAPLLRRLLECGVAPAYLRQVLGAFANGLQAPRPEQLVNRGEIVEPLTDREMEVLGLLAERLSNNEIAERLVISTLTVKRHTSRIIGKLGAKNRRDAVQRAQALGLLPPR